MPQPFVLSDGNVINSYGFRVNTAGISRDRFNANPVMLAEHNASLENVIGKWDNARIEGQQLIGDPVFDDADDMGKMVKGKVDRGFVKGASIGILFDPEKMTKTPDGNWELSECELLEASICAIPSNRAALRLYAVSDGHLMNEDEVKLSLSALSGREAIIDKTKNQKTDMKKVILSLAALTFLDLQKANSTDGVDVSLVEQAIGELKTKLDDTTGQLAAKETELSGVKTALKSLQDQATAQKKLAAEKLVNDAIASGKINATEKEAWVTLALSNEDIATKTLSAIPAKKSLNAQLDNPAGGEGAMTEEAFQKLSEAEQLRFKNEHPAAYSQLVSSLK